jgi:hypothetical protein
MSYDGVLPPWCAESGDRHDPRATYCNICRAVREVIELPDSPRPRTNQVIGAHSRNVASTARDAINQRYRSVQNANPNAGSLVVSARPATLSRTTAVPHEFSFTFVLVIETLQKDVEGAPLFSLSGGI